MIKRNLLSAFFIAFLAFFASFSAIAQMQITFPLNRMVFQRDVFNSASISITGTFRQATDVVQARVVPIQGGNQTSWQTIQTNPQGGWFSGSIIVQGGWYRLEVRGLLGGNVVTSTDIAKVGIGEVFAVGGQSNAQGFFNYGAPSAGDDRVNCVNFNNSNNQLTFPQPEYIHLDANSPVAPRGLSPWCWGRLGDLIASRYNVPVMFYNAGYFGTLARNWRESMDGAPAASVYIAANYADGMPYGNMKGLLNYYASMTGLRAILWQQGEGDNLLDTPTPSYVADLQTVINKTRQHFGKNIAWVVARDSYYNAGGKDQKVIDGQNQVIANTSNVFAGPYTDDVQPNRPDGIHFQDQGLSQVADLWNAALDQNFFDRCAPISGNYPTFSVSCSGGNNLNITVNGMSSVQWSNGSNSASVSLSPGSYQAQARDGNGNVYFIPSFNVPNDLTPQTPSITADASLQLCQGSTVSLISNLNNTIVWSTGSTSQKIDVATAGNYTLTNKNQYNCTASSSVSITQSSNPAPTKPIVTASGPLTFCLGGQVTLTSSANNGYRWSTGAQSQNITVNSAGTYEIRVVDGQGCRSELASVTVQTNNLPSVPTLSSQGSLEFCQGGQVTLSSNYPAGNIWNTGEQARDIVVNTSGSYKVRVRDSNGCEAESNTLTVKVNQLPTKPTIIAERPTTFCSGDNTVLVSSSALQYNWSNGQTTNRITTSNAGNYSLTVTDAKGCTSPISDLVTVTVNSLPAAPTITSNRTSSICQNESVIFSSNFQNKYQWSTGETTQDITANNAGAYSVRAIDRNGCASPFSPAITLKVNPLPSKPVIRPLSSTTICEGQRVLLESNYATGLTWSTFESSQQISVSSTNSYTVKYRDANGCESISDGTVVTVNSLPSAPRIINDRPTTFCKGDYTTLTIPLSSSVYDFRWSTGQTSASINVSNAGTLTATVSNPSTGCTSLASSPVNVVVNANPSTPTITVAGATTICGGETASLTANEPTATSYEWSSQVNGKTIAVGKEGNYSVRVSNQFGCISPFSNTVFIKVLPQPPAPTVIVEGPTTFCDGGQVGMRVESLFEVNWSTTETAKRIVVKQAGTYSARIKDVTGCYSPFATAIRVDTKPLPATPVIQKVGVFTLNVTNPVNQATYIWKSNGQVITESRSFLRAKQSGAYQAQAVLNYGTLTCASNPSSILDYTLDNAAGGVAVYPNPVSGGKITIESIEDLQGVSLTVYTLAGRLVFVSLVPVIDEQKQIDVSFLSPGDYVLELAKSGFRTTKKFSIMP